MTSQVEVPPLTGLIHFISGKRRVKVPSKIVADDSLIFFCLCFFFLFCFFREKKACASRAACSQMRVNLVIRWSQVPPPPGLATFFHGD